MKRKKTRPLRPDIVEEMIQRVREYQPARGAFDYTERARAVRESHTLYNESFQLTKIFPMNPDLSEACDQAHQLWYAAIENAYKPGFWDAIARLSQGDATGMEAAVAFLEEDPYFYRTGYVKTKLIRYLRPMTLTPAYQRRLRNVVLNLVDTRDDRDIRAYYSLARKVDSPELREQLTRRLTHDDPNVRRRARWVLEALERDGKKKR